MSESAPDMMDAGPTLRLDLHDESPREALRARLRALSCPDGEILPPWKVRTVEGEEISVTNRRDEERERKDEKHRREEREREREQRAGELREAWRRRRPTEEEQDKDRWPKK